MGSPNVELGKRCRISSLQLNAQLVTSEKQTTVLMVKTTLQLDWVVNC